MAANQEIDALLQELGRLVAAGLGSSDQLGAMLERLYRQGYAVRVELDGKAGSPSLVQLTLVPLKRSLPSERFVAGVLAPPAAERLSADKPSADRPAEAVPFQPYRIDGRDAAFLQSIGIDGTRRASRSRRS